MHECMGMYIIQAVVQGIQEHTEYLECVYTNDKKNVVLQVLWLSVLGSFPSVSVALHSGTDLLGTLLA